MRAREKARLEKALATLRNPAPGMKLVSHGFTNEMHAPGDTKTRDARVELNAMLDAVKRDALEYFGVGKMRAKKTLANGAVVTLSISMPQSGTTEGTKGTE